MKGYHSKSEMKRVEMLKESVKPLWNHQVLAIRTAELLPDLGLFFEQGTGKTRTLIEILRRRFAKVGSVRKTLILCPIIVCENWRNEIKMFSKINPNDVLVLTGAGKNRVRDFKRGAGDDLKGRKIIVANYESMQMEELYKLIMLWSPEVLVCDESQRLKNPQSLRAKKVAALADLSTNNYILTGTPILDGKGMDAFMQFRILDRGQTFGKNFFAFRGQYFEDKNAGFKGKQSYFPKWEPRLSAYGDLQNKIKQKAIRVLKKDCLDLPPLVRQVVYATMGKDQARMYKQMVTDYITFIENKEKSGQPKAVVAQLAITKALRLQQIVTGFATDEEGTTHRFENPRLAVLQEILEDLTPNHKVIVWAAFRENYKMIARLCDELKIEWRALTGETPTKIRENVMEDFRKDPSVRVMIANQAAGGVGVNLVEASYSIYYSKSFRLEDDLQSEARNYRGGSEIHDKVTRIDIVTPGTIDELINKTLETKNQVSDRILGWKELL
jgi:SNF2 family DNA or RNA helicase